MAQNEQIINHFQIFSFIQDYDYSFYRDLDDAFADITYEEMKKASLSKESKKRFFALQERLYCVFDRAAQKIAANTPSISLEKTTNDIIGFLSLSKDTERFRVYTNYIAINESIFKEALASAQKKGDKYCLRGAVHACRKNMTIAVRDLMHMLCVFVGSFFSPDVIEERLRLFPEGLVGNIFYDSKQKAYMKEVCFDYSFDYICSVPQIYISLEIYKKSIVFKTLPTCSQKAYTQLLYKSKKVSLLRRMRQFLDNFFYSKRVGC